jgi:5-methylcytosine-specific restriction endonuclease McrA
LASGETARSGFEWIGATPDAKVPPRVQLRILDRQAGKCAITGRKFRVGDPKRLDHIKPLADGGAHAEGNLQWIFDAQHKAGGAARRRKGAKARKGLRGSKARCHLLESRNDLRKSPSRSPSCQPARAIWSSVRDLKTRKGSKRPSPDASLMAECVGRLPSLFGVEVSVTAAEVRRAGRGAHLDRSEPS